VLEAGGEVAAGRIGGLHASDATGSGRTTSAYGVTR
jgi:hypothetical protein